LGKVTEVAAFTERRETRQVVDASVLRAKLLDTLQAALGKGISVHDQAGRSLLQELGRVSKGEQGETIEGDRVVMDSAGDGSGAQAGDARTESNSLERASAQATGADTGGNAGTGAGATPPTRHPPDSSEATPPPHA